MKRAVLLSAQFGTLPGQKYFVASEDQGSAAVSHRVPLVDKCNPTEIMLRKRETHGCYLDKKERKRLENEGGKQLYEQREACTALRTALASSR